MGGHGPGVDDPFEPRDLVDALTRVIIPVITSLIRPVELERMDIAWSAEELTITVAVQGEMLKWPLWQQRFSPPDLTMGAVAAAFAARLEQWIEERIKWGEQQIAEYTIPAAG